MNKQDTYYLYNHVDIFVEYHPVSDEDWDASHGGIGGRIVSAKLIPRRYDCVGNYQKEAIILWIILYGYLFGLITVDQIFQKRIKFKESTATLPEITHGLTGDGSKRSGTLLVCSSDIF